MKNIKIYILIFTILLNFDVTLISRTDNNQNVKVNIGISSNLFPEADLRDAKAAIEYWSKELIKDGYLDYSLVASVFKTNDEIKNAFKKNKISIAAMHALDYLYIKKEYDIIPLLIPSIKDDVTENYIILTHKNSNIKNINQLKNKKIAIQSVEPNMISFIWFENLIMMCESAMIDNFCIMEEVKKESKAIYKVFFHQNDACVVSSNVYYEMCQQNHQIADNLVVIGSSPRFIRDIFCISPNLEPEYVNNLLDATCKLQKYESGKKMMNLFKFEKFHGFDEKYIKSLEELLADNKKYHKKLKKK